MVAVLGFELKRRAPDPVPRSSLLKGAHVLSVDDMPIKAFGGISGGAFQGTTIFDGEKFPTGLGPVDLQFIDYWTLRAYSSQLFNGNLYARGLIRRLITNEINTGLTPDAAPEESVLKLSEEVVTKWGEDVENLFGIWGKSPAVCDWLGVSTFGAIQRAARTEALVNGDVLVVLRPSRRTGLQQVQLVNGGKVRSPLFPEKLRDGHTVTHGVERDANLRTVAFWVRQDDGEFKRLAAFGERSKRKVAWLVYGTDKRMDEVRGQPLLSLVLQSLKELDRYRDSAQRKAIINSILSMFIEKTEDKISTLPVTGGAVRRDQVISQSDDGGTRSFDVSSQYPGVIMEELQTGEKPVAFKSEGDVNFPNFEAAIIHAIAWANEIPPEILTLAFSNNYSASQAAINEFKIYLNKVWSDFGETFCTPIYIDWLISSTLAQKITTPGFLEAWRNPRAYDEFGAWVTVDWYGSIKPSTDMLKAAKGSKLLLNLILTTYGRESRQTTGTSYRRNAKQVKRENELRVEALRPIAEFNQEFGIVETDESTAEAPEPISEGDDPNSQ